MPALPSPGPVVHVELTFEDSADNTFGSRFFLEYTGGPPNVADMDSLATNIREHWSSDMAELQVTALSLKQVIATDLSSDMGNVGIDSTVVAGTRSGTGLLDDNSACINFKIARRYRGGKPKIFLPLGVTTDTASARTWTAGFITSVNTQWGAFIAAILGDTYTSFTLSDNVNVSYYKGFTVDTNPATGRARNRPNVRATPVVDNITGHDLRSIVGSQRRRLTSA